MALSPETISARIEALEEAIASGQLQVSYEDKTVRFRELADMFSTLEWLKNKLAAGENGGGGTTRRSRQIRMVTRDGHHGSRG